MTSRRAGSATSTTGRADVLDLLLDPMAFGFMQRGLVAAILVGIVCAVMGAFVVLRGLAFIGDAVSHAAFPGLVIAFILGIPLYIGGAIAAVGTALAIGAVARRGALRFDTAVGVLFAGMFAFGIVLFSTIQGYVTDLFSYLLGNVLGITFADIVQIAVLGGHRPARRRAAAQGAAVRLVRSGRRGRVRAAGGDARLPAARADRRDHRGQHPGGRDHHGRRHARHPGRDRPAAGGQVLGPGQDRHRRRDRVGDQRALPELLPQRRVRAPRSSWSRRCSSGWRCSSRRSRAGSRSGAGSVPRRPSGPPKATERRRRAAPSSPCR